MWRVIDVVTLLGLKDIDVLSLLSHRCLEPYQLFFKGISTRQILCRYLSYINLVENLTYKLVAI